LAQFHIALKDVPSSSEKSFRRALDVDSRNVYANAMLGIGFFKMGATREAKQHFSVALNPVKSVRSFATCNSRIDLH